MKSNSPSQSNRPRPVREVFIIHLSQMHFFPWNRILHPCPAQTISKHVKYSPLWVTCCSRPIIHSFLSHSPILPTRIGGSGYLPVSIAWLDRKAGILIICAGIPFRPTISCWCCWAWTIKYRFPSLAGESSSIEAQLAAGTIRTSPFPAVRRPKDSLWKGSRTCRRGQLVARRPPSKGERVPNQATN